MNKDLIFEKNPNFPKIEEEILEFWLERKIFTKWVRRNEGKPEFIFYEGPPTANGLPHIGHVMPRAVKDLIPRYKQMKGYHVYHRDGWDCQGLPVEIEVEKALGFKEKSEIESYGVAEFNNLCRESVLKYVSEWENFSKRIGYWSDAKNAYKTMDKEYIESLWWIIKTLWEKDLVYKGYKVMPYCPRCETTLSSHELSQGYKDTEDPSVFVEFEVEGSSKLLEKIGLSSLDILDKDKQESNNNHHKNDSLENIEISNSEKTKSNEKVFFVAWTTTPWTLPSNVALAVSKNENYCLVSTEEGSDKLYILAEKLLEKVFGEGKFKILQTFKGEDLTGISYKPLFQFGEKEEGKIYHKVVLGDFVSMDEGSGIVHTAVAYGAEDFELGKKENLGMFHLVEKNGKFSEKAGKFSGMFVKDADKEIIKDLKDRDLLLKREQIVHSYPFCWRCKTPLIYYPIEAWFIATTKKKDEIIKNNEKINWVPDHYKKGRMGNWLETMVDWNISRERYWGTPIPIWVSEDGEEIVCVGSFSELKEKAVNPSLINENFDPHRPFIDEIKLKSEKGKGELKRVPYVMDCWFDSGAMPYAQNHWPFKKKGFYPFSDAKLSMEEILKRENLDLPPDFPADFISEAIDQTRGWFYTLLVLSTLLYNEIPFKNVIVTQHGLDEKGRKQSKSLGNVLDPNKAINEAGADSLRWMIYSSDVTKPIRMSVPIVKESTKNFILPFWNAVLFYITYAEIDKFTPKFTPNSNWKYESKNSLDTWIISRLNSLIQKVTENLDSYEIWKAAKDLESFLDDLNNWYIRRSRKRFWKSENDEDKLSAFNTLWAVLINFTKLVAPFIPFTSEKIYQVLKLENDPESVHLCDYPEPRNDLIKGSIENKVLLERELVSFGLSSRMKAGIKLRQPLRKAKVWINEELLEKIDLDVVKEEINVKEIEFVKYLEDISNKPSLTPKYEILGPKFGAGFTTLNSYIEKQDYFFDLEEGKIFVGAGLKDEKVKVLAQRHSEYTLEFTEVEINFSPKENESISGNFSKKIAVSVSTDIDEELKKEGFVRDFVRNIQELRKNRNFKVSARIRLIYFTKSSFIISAIENFSDYIKSETLSVSIELSDKEEKLNNAEIFDSEFGKYSVQILENLEAQRLI